MTFMTRQIPSRKVIWHSFGLAKQLKEKCPIRNAFALFHGAHCATDPFGAFEAAEPIGSAYILPLDLTAIKPTVQKFEDRLLSATWRGVDLAMAAGKKIKLTYSGGTDSLAVLTAIIQHPRYNELIKNRQLELYLTSSSIREMPEYFSKLIHGKIPYFPMIFCEYGPSEDSVWFSGDFGDATCSTGYILPTMVEHGIAALGPNNVEMIRSAYLEADPTGLMLSIVDDIAKHCPFKITNSLQYSWWVEVCVSTQEEMFRPYSFSNAPLVMTEYDDPKYFYRPLYQPEFWSWAFEYFSSFDGCNDFNDLKSELRKFNYKHSGIENILTKRKVPSQNMIPRRCRKSVMFDDGSVIGPDYVDFLENI
jgi:hypothetical protein